MKLCINENSGTFILINSSVSQLYYENKILDCFVEMQICQAGPGGMGPFAFVRPSSNDSQKAWASALELHKGGLTISFNIKDVVIEMGHIAKGREPPPSSLHPMSDGRYIEYQSTTIDGRKDAQNEFRHFTD